MFEGYPFVKKKTVWQIFLILILMMWKKPNQLCAKGEYNVVFSMAKQILNFPITFFKHFLPLKYFIVNHWI